MGDVAPADPLGYLRFLAEQRGLTLNEFAREIAAVAPDDRVE